jgi:cytidylate kinase
MSTPMDARVVTISASFGAGGTVVGPQVADRLGLPFLERILSPALVPGSSRGDAADERPERLISRIVDALAGMPLVLGASTPELAEELNEEEQVRGDVEAGIRALAQTTGGVVLGRAGMVVLRGWRQAFHVRLDGPPDRRVRQAMRISGIDETEARRRCHETDRARRTYVKQFYDDDLDDLALYHLVIDSTAIPLDACTETILVAAHAFWSDAT